MMRWTSLLLSIGVTVLAIKVSLSGYDFPVVLRDSGQCYLTEVLQENPHPPKEIDILGFGEIWVKALVERDETFLVATIFDQHLRKRVLTISHQFREGDSTEDLYLGKKELELSEGTLSIHFDLVYPDLQKVIPSKVSLKLALETSTRQNPLGIYVIGLNDGS